MKLKYLSITKLNPYKYSSINYDIQLINEIIGW